MGEIIKPTGDEGLVVAWERGCDPLPDDKGTVWVERLKQKHRKLLETGTNIIPVRQLLAIADPDLAIYAPYHLKLTETIISGLVRSTHNLTGNSIFDVGGFPIAMASATERTRMLHVLLPGLMKHGEILTAEETRLEEIAKEVQKELVRSGNHDMKAKGLKTEDLPVILQGVLVNTCEMLTLENIDYSIHETEGGGIEIHIRDTNKFWHPRMVGSQTFVPATKADTFVIKFGQRTYREKVHQLEISAGLTTIGTDGTRSFCDKTLEYHLSATDIKGDRRAGPLTYTSQTAVNIVYFPGDDGRIWAKLPKLDIFKEGLPSDQEMGKAELTEETARMLRHQANLVRTGSSTLADIQLVQSVRERVNGPVGDVATSYWTDLILALLLAPGSATQFLDRVVGLEGNMQKLVKAIAGDQQKWDLYSYLIAAEPSVWNEPEFLMLSVPIMLGAREKVTTMPNSSVMAGMIHALARMGKQKVNC